MISNLDKAIAFEIEKSRMNDHDLSAFMFAIAWSIELKKCWPSVKTSEALKWLDDEIYSTIKYGDPEYDWSYSAAAELANELAVNYGEQS